MRFLAACLLLLTGAMPSFADESPALGRYLRTLRNVTHPTGVAVAADGTVFVTDAAHDRVVVYHPDGRIRERIEADRLGPGDEPIVAPGGIALGDDGTLFVSDTANGRVVAMAPDGATRAIGRHGSGPGELRRPGGIAVHAGLVHVADTGNDRVVVFDIAGQPVRTIGSFGQEDGRFSQPSDVAVGADGRLFVVDTDNDRVQAFDTDGNFVVAWGGWGVAPGLFTTPTGIDVRDGRVYVADTRNHRIQFFDANGRYLGKWGRHGVMPHEGRGLFDAPADVAIAPDGASAVVCETHEGRCQVFGPIIEEASGVGAPLIDKGAHYGMHLDADGDLLVMSEPDGHLVRVYNLTRDEPILVTEFGNRGRGFASFLRPSDVAIDRARNVIHVADPAQRSIKIISLDDESSRRVAFHPRMARFVRSHDFALATGGGGGRLIPAALSRSPSGELYVLDALHSRVVVFDDDMAVVRSWGTWGSGTGELRGATDLAVSPDGATVYVVDADNRRVQSFDPTGVPLHAIGGPGDGPGQLVVPFGVTVDGEGFVYVTDAGADRILKFAADGTFVDAWGQRGVRPDQLWGPRGIVLDARERLIVIDYGSHRGQLFETGGEHVRPFGGWKTIRSSGGAMDD